MRGRPGGLRTHFVHLIEDDKARGRLLCQASFDGGAQVVRMNDVDEVVFQHQACGLTRLGRLRRRDAWHLVHRRPPRALELLKEIVDRTRGGYP